jgi:hypothetical protein
MSRWPGAARQRKILNDGILSPAVGRHYGLGELLEDHGLVEVLELLEDQGLVKVLAADGGAPRCSLRPCFLGGARRGGWRRGRLSLDVVVCHGRVILTTSRILAGVGHTTPSVTMIPIVIFETNRPLVRRLPEKFHLAEGGPLVLLVLVVVVLLASLARSLPGSLTATFLSWVSVVASPGLLIMGVGLPVVVPLSGVVLVAGTR